MLLRKHGKKNARHLMYMNRPLWNLSQRKTSSCCRGQHRALLRGQTLREQQGTRTPKKLTREECDLVRTFRSCSKTVLGKTLSGLKYSQEELIPRAAPVAALGGGTAVTRPQGQIFLQRKAGTTVSSEVSTGSFLAQERPGIQQGWEARDKEG